jgi:septal ring factor EnvC (AmiA/AmiB activator)
VISDRWKKFAILVPLAPYLTLAVVLLIAALGITYYRWESELRRAAQVELLNQQQAAEITALRSGSAQAEDRAVQAEGRARQLGEELEKLTVESRQLTGKLEKLQTEGKAEQARIAALTPVEVAAEVGKEIGPSDGRTIGPSEDQLRKVLEIITDRDACVQLSTLNSQLFANCRESLVDYAAIGDQQAKQIQELKQALDLGKRAFDKRDDLAKVQVQTAQGTWIHRAWNKVKFPVGIVLGGVGGYMVGRETAGH